MRTMLRLGIATLLLPYWSLSCTVTTDDAEHPAPVADRAQHLIDRYIEQQFDTYPTQAVEAGRHDFDDQLEDLSPQRLASWIAFNRATLEQISPLAADADLPFDHRLDLELIAKHARLALFDLETLELPRNDPLFWTRPIANATVFLLVRDDAPLSQRLAGAIARARQLPRLAEQARSALGSGQQLPAEIVRIAERQLRAAAEFYAEGFSGAAGDAGDAAALRDELAAAGSSASAALRGLADWLQQIEPVAAGSPRLGEHYATRFRLVTGEKRAVGEVLASARRALIAKREETAAFGREVWPELLPFEQPPADDGDLIRRLFSRVAQDHATSVDEFVEDYKDLLARSVDFVREHDLITLPEPLTVKTARSPSFFVGQSVGGVYPAGPYAPPDAETLFYLPTPSAESTAEQRASFFRDFNDHFAVMITPHEMVPGHYLQLKLAARHPRKARALFGDGIYIEGWGTFCERLLLDQGWGGAADRLAHLKKQLENIARTIVDVRVHTERMSRQEVLDFVRDEAFQETQFAANMWTRAITSSPQLTSYYLGYNEVMGLYREVREQRGSDFVLKEFMDGMMELGPVAVAHYRRRMLGAEAR